jgi:hypothetical protein
VRSNIRCRTGRGHGKRVNGLVTGTWETREGCGEIKIEDYCTIISKGILG